MQTFYSKLVAAQATQDDYWQALARVTRIRMEQMQALAGEVDWNVWG